MIHSLLTNESLENIFGKVNRGIFILRKLQIFYKGQLDQLFMNFCSSSPSLQWRSIWPDKIQKNKPPSHLFRLIPITSRIHITRNSKGINVKYNFFINSFISICDKVGNKAKGWISKRMFQENKAWQIFRKTNISYPLIRTRISG